MKNYALMGFAAIVAGTAMSVGYSDSAEAQEFNLQGLGPLNSVQECRDPLTGELVDPSRCDSNNPGDGGNGTGVGIGIGIGEGGQGGQGGHGYGGHGYGGNANANSNAALNNDYTNDSFFLSWAPGTAQAPDAIVGASASPYHISEANSNGFSLGGLISWSGGESTQRLMTEEEIDLVNQYHDGVRAHERTLAEMDSRTQTTVASIYAASQRDVAEIQAHGANTVAFIENGVNGPESDWIKDRIGEGAATALGYDLIGERPDRGTWGARRAMAVAAAPTTPSCGTPEPTPTPAPEQDCVQCCPTAPRP